MSNLQSLIESTTTWQTPEDILAEYDTFAVFGTGGCGCVANNTRWPSTFEQDFPTYYRIQRSKNVLLANIMDQGSRLTKPQNNPFNEIGCNPDSENKILVEDFNGEKMVTDVFDRPVVLIST